MSNYAIKDQKRLLTQAANSGTANCYDSIEKRYTRIDFNKHGFAVGLSKAYAASYQTIHCDAAVSSHKGYRGLLNQIYKFHLDHNIKSLRQIHTKTIIKLIEWLNSPNAPTVKSRSTAYKHSIYTFYKNLVKSIPEDITNQPSKIHWPVNPFPNKYASSRKADVPTKAEFEHISNVLLEKINRFQNRLKLGHKIRNGSISNKDNLSAAILDLKINEHSFFDCSYPKPHSAADRLIKNAGGIKFVSSHLYPCREYIEYVFRFIQMHTGANPAALIEIDTNSLQPIPLLKSKTNLVIEKRRGYQKYTILLSKNGKNSPAQILENLGFLITLLQKSNLTKSNKLFQDYSCSDRKRKDKIKPVYSFTALKYHVRTLEIESGTNFYSLKSWRAYQLTRVQDETGDILKTKKAANHSDIRTTKRYIDSSLLNQQIKTSLITLTSEHLSNIRKKPKINFVGTLRKRKTKNNNSVAVS